MCTAGSSYAREELTHIKSFYQVFPSVRSRNADTSPWKEERCDRESRRDNSDLKDQCYISWMATGGSFSCEANRCDKSADRYLLKQHSWTEISLHENSITNLLFKALPRKSRNLCRIVEHYGHNWRVIVTKNLKTHLLELWPEEITVLTDACKFLGTCRMSHFLIKSNTRHENIADGASRSTMPWAR